MVSRRFTRLSLNLFAAGALAATVLAGAPPASAAPVAASASAARVLYYDARGAAEFVAAVNEGAANWNGRVTNVRLESVPAGRRANITVLADNGWPRALVTSLGNGRIYMGRAAVTLGHHPPRIAAHEFGHVLGLPDRRTGLCADLMSGSSAPASCRNAFPNAVEAARVQRLFQTTTLVPAGATPRSYDDAPGSDDRAVLVANGQPA